MAHQTVEACCIQISEVKQIQIISYELCYKYFCFKHFLNRIICFEMKELKNHVYKRKGYKIGDCKATVCGLPVSHRIKRRMIQRPCLPVNLLIRILPYCDLILTNTAKGPKGFLLFLELNAIRF